MSETTFDALQKARIIHSAASIAKDEALVLLLECIRASTNRLDRRIDSLENLLDRQRKALAAHCTRSSKPKGP